MRRSYLDMRCGPRLVRCPVWTGPGKARWALDKQSRQAPLPGETRIKRASVIGQSRHDRGIFLGLDRVALFEPS